MTVDHREAVVTIIQQERLSDPAQVRLGLLFKLHTGADPGVNEEIVPEAARIHESLEKLRVLSRDRALDRCKRL